MFVFLLSFRCPTFYTNKGLYRKSQKNFWFNVLNVDQKFLYVIDVYEISSVDVTKDKQN